MSNRKLLPSVGVGVGEETRKTVGVGVRTGNLSKDRSQSGNINKTWYRSIKGGPKERGQLLLLVRALRELLASSLLTRLTGGKFRQELQ